MSVVVAKDVGAVEQDGLVYVASLPQGPILVLSGAAADIWRRVSAGGEVDRAVELDDEHVSALVAAGLLIMEKDV